MANNSFDPKDFKRMQDLLKASYDTYEEMAIYAAGTFNLLEESKVDYKEAVHTNILAFLLGSKNKHRHPEIGQKFISKLNNKNSKLSFPENGILSVETEKWIYCPKSKVNPDRRLDIYIESNYFILIIENKIGSEDETDQISDYYKWLEKEAKEKNKKFLMLYLTLYGDDPKKSFLNNGEVKKLKDNGTFMTLSYEDDILPWLVKSLEEKEDKNEGKSIYKKNETLLKSAIAQYIDTLKGMFGCREEELIMFKNVVKELYKNNPDYEFDKLKTLKKLSFYFEKSYTLFIYIEFIKTLNKRLKSLKDYSEDVYFTQGQKRFKDSESWLNTVFSNLEDIGIAVTIDRKKPISIGLELDNFLNNPTIYFGIMLHKKENEEIQDQFTLESPVSVSENKYNIIRDDSKLWSDYIEVPNLLKTICDSMDDAIDESIDLFEKQLKLS